MKKEKNVLSKHVGDVPAVAPVAEALGGGAVEERLPREHDVRGLSVFEDFEAVADHRQRRVGEAAAAVDGLVLKKNVVILIFFFFWKKGQRESVLSTITNLFFFSFLLPSPPLFFL